MGIVKQPTEKEKQVVNGLLKLRTYILVLLYFSLGIFLFTGFFKDSIFLYTNITLLFYISSLSLLTYLGRDVLKNIRDDNGDIKTETLDGFSKNGRSVEEMLIVINKGFYFHIIIYISSMVILLFVFNFSIYNEEIISPEKMPLISTVYFTSILVVMSYVIHKLNWVTKIFEE